MPRLPWRAGPAQAAFIHIFEAPTEGGLITFLTDMVAVSVAGLTPESLDLTGFHFPSISPSPVDPGVYAANLLEPGSPPPGPDALVSDVVIVEAFEWPPVGGCPAGVPPDEPCQELHIVFFSDPISAAALDPFLPGVIETGGLDDLTSALGLAPDSLFVRAQSDVIEAPLPAALLLLASGLVPLGLAAYRRGR